MAIFRPSPLVAEIRNSLGGSVFTRGPTGSVIRSRLRPTRMPSHMQTYATGNHMIKSRHWRENLTAANRAAWNAAALDVRWTNAIGDEYSPSGYLLYIRQASGIPGSRFALPTVPPGLLKTPPPPVYLHWEEANDHIYIRTWPNQPPPANGWLTVWHSDTLPPTVYHFRGHPNYRGIRTFTNGVAINHPITQADPTYRPSRVWFRIQASLTRYTQSNPIFLSINIPPEP